MPTLAALSSTDPVLDSGCCAHHFTDRPLNG
jgi:hypothetical protein